MTRQNKTRTESEHTTSRLTEIQDFSPRRGSRFCHAADAGFPGDVAHQRLATSRCPVEKCRHKTSKGYHRQRRHEWVTAVGLIKDGLKTSARGFVVLESACCEAGNSQVEGARRVEGKGRSGHTLKLTAKHRPGGQQWNETPFRFELAHLIKLQICIKLLAVSLD